jgi:hypothetical protein
MRAPQGEVTLFEGMGDALAGALFLFLGFLFVVIGAVVWAVVNFKRRPRWTGKVLLLTIAAPLLLITPLVWKNTVDSRESYPTRYQAYEAELADYRSHNDCSAPWGCLSEPLPPDNPVVNVPLYIILFGVGALSLVAGLRIKATDRRDSRTESANHRAEKVGRR